jgi:hypothetical protein
VFKTPVFLWKKIKNRNTPPVWTLPHNPTFILITSSYFIFNYNIIILIQRTFYLQFFLSVINMSAATKAIYIVGAKRTPFGAFGGKLKTFSATDLAVLSSKAALAHANVSPNYVDETIFGNVIGSSLDAAYLSRHVALKSGVPTKAPSLTINRLCGSGFETVCLGAEAIQQVRLFYSFLFQTQF